MTLDTLDVTTNEPKEETDNFARDEFGDIAEHFANALLGDEERARYKSISETLGALISTVKVWESVHLAHKLLRHTCFPHFACRRSTRTNK
jgi:hypothetical protein